MPTNPDKPRCLLCGVNASFRQSAICRACHEIVRGRGQVWCNAGLHAVSRNEWQKSGRCKACNNARTRARAAAKRTTPRTMCLLCHERGTERGSAICQVCRGELRASGRAWCYLGKHVVDAGELLQPGRCAACANAADRAAYAERSPAITGVCGTCSAPLAGHKRCKGCTRLLHGDAAKEPLCHLCARDRANGVPPQGYGLREMEVAA